MSSCFFMTIIDTILKNTLDLNGKTHVNNNKFWKMCTIVEFRLLILESLKYSSKVESSIIRSTNTVISRSLTTSWQNHLFICFVFFIFIYFYFYLFLFLFLFFFSCIYRKQALQSYLHSDSSRCYCWAWVNKKISTCNLGI